MEFSRPEYWSRQSSPVDLPNPGIKPRSLPHGRHTLYQMSHWEVLSYYSLNYSLACKFSMDSESTCISESLVPEQGLLLIGYNNLKFVFNSKKLKNSKKLILT